MRTGWGALGLLLVWVGVSEGHLVPRPLGAVRVNLSLKGQLIDHTANHGVDRRFWSPALGQKRDMYVYLPPGYCANKQYPLCIYLHGFMSDEINFLELVVKPLDRAISQGRLPPVIIAAPDATVTGRDVLVTKGTFYVNSKLGRFQDYLIDDVYGFLMKHYPIRPEAEAHALLGASMGGAAAFCKVMKHRDKFGIATAFAPPLNVRWMHTRDGYFGNFDPRYWGWRENFDDCRAVIGKLCGGLVQIRLSAMIEPLYGKHNPQTAALVSMDNPIEMLERLNIGPGFAEFYVAYGGQDEFNLDAQVESFLYVARQRGVGITVDYDPHGHHSVMTALRMLPGMIDWLRPRLEPYSPR